MGFEFRDMRSDDFNACCALWSNAGMAHEPDIRSRLETLLRISPGMSFVAFDGQRVVGAILGSFNGFSGYMFRLVVASTHRGKGIGVALTTKCEAAFLEAGAAKSILVCEDEVAEFYAKLGYLKTSAKFMMKQLA